MNARLDNGRAIAKSQIRRVARRLGWEVRRLDADAYLGLFASRLIADFGLNCVIDVGANAGQFGRMLRSEGYRGEILSYEPVGVAFDQLTETVARDHRWRTHRLALGAHTSEAQMNVMHSSNMSSLLRPAPAALDHWTFVEPVERTEVVNVVRLDEVLCDHLPRLDPPRLYLKIDTQGTDLDVIKGATGVLGWICAIQTELSFKPLYDGQTSYKETLDYLASLGYEVAGMFPVVHDDNASIIEADCVLVHRDLKHP